MLYTCHFETLRADQEISRSANFLIKIFLNSFRKPGVHKKNVSGSDVWHCFIGKEKGTENHLQMFHMRSETQLEDKVLTVDRNALHSSSSNIA